MADFKFPEKIFFDFRRPAYSREIERIEAEKGALRRKSTQNNDAAKSDVEIFPPQADQGATRDIVAKAVGFSVLAQF